MGLLSFSLTKDAREHTRECSLKNVSSLVSSITTTKRRFGPPFSWFVRRSGGSALPRKSGNRSRRASHASCFVVNCFLKVDGKGVLVRPTKRPTGRVSSRARGTSDRRRSCQSSFCRVVLFLFLPRDTVSIDLCFFVIRSIQDKDKLVLRSYLSWQTLSHGR